MPSVKTAVSLPEDVFASLVAIAEETGRSRSAVLLEALEEFLHHRESEAMTRAYDEVYGSMTDEDQQEDRAWVRHAAIETFKRLDSEDGGWRGVDDGDSG